MHRGNIGPWTDADVFRQWRPPTVKIVWDGVKIPYLEDVPPSSKILWRNYQLSVQFDGGLDLGGVRSLSGEPAAPPVIGVNGLPQNGSGKDRMVRAMSASSASGQPTPEQAAEVYVNNAVEIAAYAPARASRKNGCCSRGRTNTRYGRTGMRGWRASKSAGCN